MSNDLTPNERDTPKIRLRNAKAWLIDYPEEKQSTAARIFKINRRTLSNSIKRVTNPSHGGHNKILSDAQEHAVDVFIRDLLSPGQQPTRTVLFEAICRIRQPFPPPSTSWFGKWWKNKKGLYRVETKPITEVRVTAQDQRKVDRMFKKNVREWKKALRRLAIHRRKAERRRKAELKSLLPDDIGAAHLQVIIPDPETEAKRAKTALLPGLQLSTQQANVMRGQEEIERREDGIGTLLSKATIPSPA